MWRRRHVGLGLAAGAFFLAIVGTAAVATCDGQDDMTLVTVTAPRDLAPGEAFALVAETGSLVPGDVLAFRDEDGNVLGSVVGTLSGGETQKQTVALIRDMPAASLTLSAEVVPSGDQEPRAPREGELLSLQLVPMAVDP